LAPKGLNICAKEDCSGAQGEMGKGEGGEEISEITVHQLRT
jgi:hypothetical protein